MVQRPFLGLLLICFALSLSGCVALSFGGKEVTMESPPSDEVTGRLNSLEGRMQTVEQRLGMSGPAQVPPATP